MEKSRYATKKKGKTEVYPFWRMEDIKGMMDYFKNNEQWANYTTFSFGLLFGRRVGDTLAMRWSDLFYENGQMKDEITTIEEEKTGKVVSIPICKLGKDIIGMYIEKTGATPINYLDDFVFPFSKKTKWKESINLDIYSSYTTDDEQSMEFIDMWCTFFNKDFGLNRRKKIFDDWKKQERYSDIESYLCYEVDYKDALKCQSEMYRRDFKEAAKHCNISYAVSTHSTRKTFGYWSKQIHPYDVDCMEILQDVFAHTDIKTTMRYIGLTAERKKQYFDDMGDFISNVEKGNQAFLKNAPVISLKSSDLRNILLAAIKNENHEEPVDLMNCLMEMVESVRV